MKHSARSWITALLATAAVHYGAEIQGAVYVWQSSSGDWAMASNWGGTAPTANDAAYVIDGGTATVSLAGATCGTLTLGSGTTSGTVQISAGGLAVPGQIYLAPFAGTSGAISLGGAGSLSSPSESIGYAGTGSFNQTGGSNSSASGVVYLGFGTGSSGTYNLAAGLSSEAYEYVAWSGSGNLTQSGGTNSVASNLYLGFGAGGSGTYSLSGSGHLFAFFESVGGSGGGIFNQTGGTNTIGINGNGNVNISSGYYSLAGGVLNGTEQGSLSINGGGMQVSGGTLDGNGFGTITAGSGSPRGPLRQGDQYGFHVA